MCLLMFLLVRMRLIGLLVFTVLVHTALATKESEKPGNPIHADHYDEGEHDETYDHEAVLGKTRQW